MIREKIVHRLGQAPRNVLLCDHQNRRAPQRWGDVVALPQANPGVYVTLSLAVTFPFNVVIGIPLYLWVAETLL